MLNYLYAISYLTLLSSAVAWFFFKERGSSIKSFFTGGFWVGLAMYVLSFLLGDGGWWYKLILLFPRDLMIFSLAVLVFNKFVTRSNIFVGLALAAGVLVKVFYFGVLVNSLDERGFGKYSEMFSWTSAECCMTKGKASSKPLTYVDSNAEILVEIAEGSSVENLEQLLENFEATIEPAFPHLQHKEFSNLENFYKINIKGTLESDLEEVTKELKKAKNVLSFEVNETVQTTPLYPETVMLKTPNETTNDKYIGFLWGFNNMNVKELHTLLKGMKPQKVAKIYILDTGVDGTHEDLQDVFFSTNPSYNSDKVGHGTHCAGIAAAVSNNGKGIASFAPNTTFVQVTSIKVLNDNGGGTQEGIIDGIIEAADAGADVISMSLGGISYDEGQAYTEAVEYANKAGAIVVVAAGNSDEDAQGYCPANAKGVITVSAVDENNDKAEFSNYVDNIAMGIAAPGVNIYSTVPNNLYQYMNGTSMATPYVAGLVGVMKALNPALTTPEIYAILKGSGVDTKNTAKTGKLIQPAEAVKRIVNQ